MRGEIIAIGDELTSGRVMNATSSFAASRLFSAGYPINRITTVGDDPKDIQEAVTRAMTRSRFVIVTGGLGPTTDDITNETVSVALGIPLVLNEGIQKRIMAHGKTLGATQADMIRKLAYLPEGAQVLDPFGSAAGYALEHGGVSFFFLPGIPEQMERLLVDAVLPRLHALVSPDFSVRRRTYRTFGLLETEINAMVGDLAHGDLITIGYYPVFPEVHVTVTARDHDKRAVDAAFLAACKETEARLGENIVATDDDTLESVVGRLLTERGGLLATAESCTGGLIASRITRVPGSSAWFDRGVITYSNCSKIQILGVPEEILERHGAVSEETAIHMVKGIIRIAHVPFGIAVTGIAGPSGGTEEKPVGTVHIALATPDWTASHRFRFSGTRSMIQESTAETALDWLRRTLQYGTRLPCDRSAR
ncbi:MAG: CinA family nicotinamide mononucleotide deamidase-related protein [Deltaproteobacteria bacterium]